MLDLSKKNSNRGFDPKHDPKLSTIGVVNAVHSRRAIAAAFGRQGRLRRRAALPQCQGSRETLGKHDTVFFCFSGGRKKAGCCAVLFEGCFLGSKRKVKL